jgi:hypothetical protein
MYIWQGEKYWEFLNPIHAPRLFDPATKWLEDRTPDEMVEAVGGTSKLFVKAEAKKCDFVYFPPAWMHRVRTDQKTMGLGGYIRPEKCLETLKEIEDMFVKTKVMTYWDEEVTE